MADKNLKKASSALEKAEKEIQSIKDNAKGADVSEKLDKAEE